MGKQEKVLNKIKHSTNSGQTTPLGTKPNDECYTSMQDIINELARWAELGKFKDKNIICPCDWDIVDERNIYSITIKYLDNGIDATQKMQVSYDMWADTLWGNPEENKVEITKINLKEEEIV